MVLDGNSSVIIGAKGVPLDYVAFAVIVKVYSDPAI
jgi:hypothetical protein